MDLRYSCIWTSPPIIHDPNIRAYLARIGARPAFKRAMAKADPGFKVPLD